MKRPYVSRRQVLIGASCAALPFSMQNANSQEVPSNLEMIPVASYILNKNVEDVNIHRVRDGLEENIAAKESKYIPDFLFLIQKTRVQVTGYTIHQTMAENLDEHGDIEVVLVDNFKRIEGADGRFYHAASKQDTNKAKIESTLKTPSFVETTSHELQHASYGEGEPTAYGLSYHELATMHALNPVLRTIAPKADPLVQYLDVLKDCMAIQNGEVLINPALAEYLIVLFSLTLDDVEHLSPSKDMSLDTFSRVLRGEIDFEPKDISKLTERILQDPGAFNRFSLAIPQMAYNHIMEHGHNMTSQDRSALEEKLLDPGFKILKTD